MKTPNFVCEISVICPINPSEDQEKIERAISNILSDVNLKKYQNLIRGSSKNLEALSKIYETIHSRKTQRTYRRKLNQNLDNNSTWFYLNKQAAFSNIIAMCGEEDESPLGPIKVILNSQNLDRIIEWLVSDKSSE